MAGRGTKCNQTLCLLIYTDPKTQPLVVKVCKDIRICFISDSTTRFHFQHLTPVSEREQKKTGNFFRDEGYPLWGRQRLAVWKILITVAPVTSDTTLKYVGHQMIMITQCGEFLDLARGRSWETDNKLTASLWRESQELYYQTSTAATQPCGSKHAAQVFVILLALLVIFFPTICVVPETLFHPCLASPMTDCLICSLMFSRMQQPYCGSLVSSWTCISLPDRRRKKVKSTERNRALSCPVRVKDRETEKTWGQKGGQKSHESHRRPAILRFSQREKRDRASRV